MTGLWTAVSGLTVNQNALNTTAHNLANIDTNGATRQQVIIQDFHYNSIGQSAYSTMQTGLGAATQVVRQVRDEFYDKQYRTESGRLGFYDAQQDTILEIEDVMGELENSPFQLAIDALWTSTQELVKSPDDKSVRTVFAKNAQSFIQRAESIYKQLEAYQVNMNTKIIKQVDQVNEYARKIADLNTQITKVEAGGVERANDLRDQRNVYADKLSSLIDIKAVEQYDGSLSIMAENTQLVAGGTAYSMSTTRVEDGTDMVKAVWDHTGTDVFSMDRVPNYETNTNIGSLKGLIWARGNDAANYTDIPVREDFATDADYNDAVDVYNLRVESSTVRTIQAQFDNLIHGITTTINNILSPVTSDIASQLPTTSSSTATLTINGVAQTIDLSTNKDVKIMCLDAPVGMNDDKTQGTELFARKSTDRYTDATLTYLDETGAPQTINVKVYNEENPADKYSLYTLGEIEVNEDILADYSLLPLSEENSTGDYAYNNVAKKLSEAWNKEFSPLSPNAEKSDTFYDYYTSMWGGISTKGEQYIASTKNQTTMVDNIATARQNVMGISSDEELANMIKYQHAYSAAARYFNVVDSMLEHLVTRL